MQRIQKKNLGTVNAQDVPQVDRYSYNDLHGAYLGFNNALTLETYGLTKVE